MRAHGRSSQRKSPYDTIVKGTVVTEGSIKEDTRKYTEEGNSNIGTTPKTPTENKSMNYSEATKSISNSSNNR